MENIKSAYQILSTLSTNHMVCCNKQRPLGLVSHYENQNIEGLVQDWGNSIAKALDWPQFCISHRHIRCSQMPGFTKNHTNYGKFLNNDKHNELLPSKTWIYKVEWTSISKEARVC